MGVKIVKNPKTGMSETIHVPDHDPKALADLHREVKDMLDGNKQFHEDPYAKPRQPVLPKELSQEDEDHWYNHIGF